MSGDVKKIFQLAALAATIVAAPAHAQYIVQYSDGQGGYGYRTEPLYPYVAQPQVIYPQQQAAPRAYPYVRPQHATPAAPRVSKADPVLIEELKLRAKKKKEAQARAQEQAEAVEESVVDQKPIKKTIVVRDKPVVREHVRVVDDPPIIVRREIDVDQVSSVPSHVEVPPTGRVIRAEAEVTIVGPDRMTIRLFRKRDGSDANAKATKAEVKAEAKAEKTKIR